MFTGIVSGLGTLVAREGSQFVIHTPYKRKSLELGASLACDGCCLTLTQIEKAKGEGSLVAVDVSNETLSHTTLGSCERVRKINLERAFAWRGIGRTYRHWSCRWRGQDRVALSRWRQRAVSA